jgi:hypothetical protein
VIAFDDGEITLNSRPSYTKSSPAPKTLQTCPTTTTSLSIERALALAFLSVILERDLLLARIATNTHRPASQQAPTGTTTRKVTASPRQSRYHSALSAAGVQAQPERLKCLPRCHPTGTQQPDADATDLSHMEIGFVRSL